MYFVQSVGDPTSGLIAQPVRSLLKDWGEDATSIAAFMGLLALPWALKPLLGLVADFVPLRGSRRRNPLILASLASGAGLLVLAFLPIPEGARWLLMALLLVPTIGIALGDVLVDALMIEEGQPRGLTGRFQSIQWTAANAALLLAGVLGGYFSERSAQQSAFFFCALLWGTSLVLTLLFVRERPAPRLSGNWSAHARVLRSALRAPGLATACGILFLWSFNPLWVSVLYLHMTEGLGFSEQFYGTSFAVFSGGAMAASAGYGFYCRRVKPGLLVHVSIVAGIVANAVYWHLGTETVALLISAVAGFAFMTGTLIQLDVAARLVPVAVAATLFAAIMGLTNLAASLSEALGGWSYDLVQGVAGEEGAFRIVVASSVCFPAACWLLLPRLKREIPAWWGG